MSELHEAAEAFKADAADDRLSPRVVARVVDAFVASVAELGAAFARLETEVRDTIKPAAPKPAPPSGKK